MGDVQGLADLALNKWTLLTAGGIFLLLRVLKDTPIAKLGIYRRLLPVLPEMFGVAAAFGGGIPSVDGQPVVIRIAAGLWCGYVAQRGHKLLGQAILGDDPKLEAKKAKRLRQQAETEK
jgi:hypothetical protein